MGIQLVGCLAGRLFSGYTVGRLFSGYTVDGLFAEQTVGGNFNGLTVVRVFNVGTLDGLLSIKVYTQWMGCLVGTHEYPNHMTSHVFTYRIHYTWALLS